MSQMPPTHIDPTDLWLQIMQMPRASRLADLPFLGVDGRPIGQCLIWVLTHEETMACTHATEKWVRKALKAEDSMPSNGEPSEGYGSLFDKRSTLEILFRCCRRATNINLPFFPSIEEMQRKCTTDQLAVLLRSYLVIQSELGPISSTMTEAEVDYWQERLAKGGGAFPFASLSLGAQSSLLKSLACRASSLPTATSSVGTPPVSG